MVELLEALNRLSSTASLLRLEVGGCRLKYDVLTRSCSAPTPLPWVLGTGGAFCNCAGSETCDVLAERLRD